VQHEQERNDQHRGGRGRVLPDRRRRRDPSVDDAHEYGCEHDEDRGLRGQQRLGQGAVPQPHGVAKVRDSGRERCNQDGAERAAVDLGLLAVRVAAEQQPDRGECQHQRDRHGAPHGLAQDCDRQERGHEEVETEDRGADADRSAREAAQEIVEPDEEEQAREPAPGRGRMDRQRAGRPGVEDDDGREAPRLAHQEMIRLHARCGGILVDEVAEPVADQRREGVSGPVGHAISVFVTRPDICPALDSFDRS
jgi:hypothetical protein